VRVRTASSVAFACLSRSCAPPPVGRGGSSGGGGGRSGGRGLPDLRFGDVRITYEPDYPDDGPDPGEIVWAKVHFEDDPRQSKDRPVLVIGRINGGKSLAAVQLTSKEGRPDSMPIGKGTWDRDQRPSAVKLDRIVQIDESDYRREGAVMPRAKFTTVVRALDFVQAQRRRGKR
jgi:hypothetical protein